MRLAVLSTGGLALTGVFAALLALGCGDKAGDASGAGNAAAGGVTVDQLLNSATVAFDEENWAKALEKLDAALADPRATAAEKALAWQDRLICVARLGGEETATAEFKKFTLTGIKLTSDQVASLIQGLNDGECVKTALEVLKYADAQFKGDKAVVKKLRKLAKNLQGKLDAAGQADLAALGYLSSSPDDEEDETTDEKKNGGN